MRKIYSVPFLPWEPARKLLLLFIVLLYWQFSFSQVYTTTYATSKVSAEGLYSRSVTMETITLSPQNNEALLKREVNAGKDAPFKFALPIGVDITPGKQGQWMPIGEGMLVWRVKIVSKTAYSASIDFDEFQLSDDAEMYIYNGDGTMITGPVTSKENNEHHVWGSSIYSGGSVIIEVKVPERSVSQCRLHINNFSHGYKNLFKSEKTFGASGNCNINVLCPAGSAWSAERNSVALILNASSSEHCTGAMVMNTCGTNIPYFLTANHCYTAPNAGSVSNWKFIFQYWSPNCTPNTDGSRSVLFNGATLRASNGTSDFTLLELNNTPPSGSGITYAGWNRSSTPATNTTGIHHPSGDVMKISFHNNAPSKTDYGGSSGSSHWEVNWSSGVTEGGSSGSPLFDQNHRVVGQLHGGNSACGSGDMRDWYGAFDISWAGGLSYWLDPGNTIPATNLTTTNTTNVASLSAGFSAGAFTPIIVGSSLFCSGSQDYTLSGAPPGSTVTWVSNNPNIGYFSTNGGHTATLTKGPYDGYITITATVNGTCRYATYEVFLGAPVVEMMTFTNGVGGEGYFCTSHANNEYHITPLTPSTGYNMRMLSWPSLSVVSTWGPTYNTGTVYTYIPGWYVLEAQAVNVCGTSPWTGYEVEFMDCTGWGRMSGDIAGIKTWPNPVRGDLYVIIGKENVIAKNIKPNETVHATLYNFYSSQVVKTWRIRGNDIYPQKLDVRDVKKGQYILVISTSSGKHRQTKQVIIE